MKEWGNLDIHLVLACVYPQDRGLTISVHKGVDHESLLLINEGLSKFLKLLHFRVDLVHELDVLTSRYLAFLNDPLIILVVTNLVIIRVRIVLSGHSYLVFGLTTAKQVMLLNLEDFSFHVLR